MELNPSWEAASAPATQEYTSILYNPKDHYCVHKGPTLAFVLSQMSPDHTTPSKFQFSGILPPASRSS
jgi:hypothetical protein